MDCDRKFDPFCLWCEVIDPDSTTLAYEIIDQNSIKGGTITVQRSPSSLFEADRIAYPSSFKSLLKKFDND